MLRIWDGFKIAGAARSYRGSLAVQPVAPTFQASSDSTSDPSWVAIFWGPVWDGGFVDQMGMGQN